MRLIVFCLCLMTVITACEKDGNSDIDTGVNELIGRYTGTFVRTGLDTAIVNIFFKEDGTFEGSSNAVHYPAICRGTFERDGLTLLVNDTCAWTANFDWTLIFDGNYSISLGENNTARIWRTTGTVTDEYLLTRYTR